MTSHISLWATLLKPQVSHFVDIAILFICTYRFVLSCLDSDNETYVTSQFLSSRSFFKLINVGKKKKVVDEHFSSQFLSTKLITVFLKPEVTIFGQKGGFVEDMHCYTSILMDRSPCSHKVATPIAYPALSSILQVQNLAVSAPQASFTFGNLVRWNLIVLEAFLVQQIDLDLHVEFQADLTYSVRGGVFPILNFWALILGQHLRTTSSPW